MTSAIERLPQWAREMFDEARVARLGLLDDQDHPRVLPVTFALHEDVLYSAVDEKPKRVASTELARVRYLRRRPEVALTVDRYSDDWSELAWVQVLGRVDLVEIDTEPEARAALLAKYEPYRELPPAGPLLKLLPDRTLCWRASG